ncbi:MAG: polysaccharide deacetylase family protein [Bacteroidales bacterium]|nr:polysaccharide deacetylase family protein [Bacteroidales bacterium]
MKSILYPSAFTIDVEDGINIAMRDHFGVHIPPTDRVVTNTNRLLQLLNDNNVKATFFILGQIATHYPGLVKNIQKEGHELGVHGYDHIQLFKLTPEAAKNDLLKAKQCVEDIIGESVKGFRAPAFSVIPTTVWALDILAEAGFTYDSSIVPGNALRYGWPYFPDKIQKLVLPNESIIIEAPLPVVSFLWWSLPVCGGGYLRTFPYWFNSRALRTVIKKGPAMVYMHPYEIDTDRYPEYFYDALKKAPLKTRLRLKSIRFNKETVLNKLERLFQDYSFDRLDNIIDNYINENDVITRKLNVK